MKKQILLVFVFAVCANWAMAQDYGIRGFSSLVNLVSDKPGYDSKAMLGYGGGIFGKFEINNKIFFQPEINYNVKGAIYPGTIDLLGTTYKTDAVSSLSYLEVPLHLEHDLTKHLGVEFGPYFGYLLGVNTVAPTFVITTVNNVPTVTSSNLTTHDRTWIKNFDFGVNLGFNYEVYHNLFLEARYSLGLMNISNVSNSDYYLKNRVASFGIAYSFAKSKTRRR